MKKGENLGLWIKEHGPWNKGKKASTESRKRMSEAHKASYKNGKVHPMLGKKHSEATKKHWRELRKGIDYRTPATIKKVSEEWSKRRGLEVPSWKGGVTPVHRIVRTMPEYKIWRKSVYERDNYACQVCNKRGEKLNADHIVPFSVILEVENIRNRYDARKCEVLWDIENGRTLCEKCHKKSPSVLWRRLQIQINYLKQELKTLNTKHETPHNKIRL